MTAWPYYLFAIAAGAMLPIQFGVNAQLASWIGSPLRATLVSFAVGTAVLLVAALIFARGWPGSEKLGAAPWWVWVGGFLGAFYVLGSVVTAPKLGAAALFAFILAGQAVASLAVDHFGWVGFDENPVTPGRLSGSRSWRPGWRRFASSRARPLETESRADLRVGERLADEIGRGKDDAGEGGDPDREHSRRADGADTRGRVLESDRPLGRGS